MTKEQVVVIVNFLRLIVAGFGLLFVRFDIPKEHQEEFERREKDLESGFIDAFGFYRK